MSRPAPGISDGGLIGGGHVPMQEEGSRAYDSTLAVVSFYMSAVRSHRHALGHRAISVRPLDPIAVCRLM
jgi:hypothetical protein